eukprot:832555-Lingulodinium_polyedra.AAC.1
MERERAIRAPPWRRTVDSTAPLRNICKTPHNHAGKSTVRGRSGSHIARSSASRARQFSGAH